jgi:hypothetical protein
MVMQVYQAADRSVETNKPVELTVTEIPTLATTSA